MEGVNTEKRNKWTSAPSGCAEPHQTSCLAKQSPPLSPPSHLHSDFCLLSNTSEGAELALPWPSIPSSPSTGAQPAQKSMKCAYGWGRGEVQPHFPPQGMRGEAAKLPARLTERWFACKLHRGKCISHIEEEPHESGLVVFLGKDSISDV